jgi:uncharacterized protein YdhG (YjbR/CyaY superfamily)
MRSNNTHKTVDDYISTFPEEVQTMLQQLRKVIRNAAPDAKEKISYNMPAFTLNGILVYFAGYKNHIGLYASPSGNAAFKKELAKYKTGKGSIQFPLNEGLPLNLIKIIVGFRVKENLLKVKKNK